MTVGELQEILKLLPAEMTVCATSEGLEHTSSIYFATVKRGDVYADVYGLTDLILVLTVDAECFRTKEYEKKWGSV